MRILYFLGFTCCIIFECFSFKYGWNPIFDAIGGFLMMSCFLDMFRSEDN